MGFPGRKSHPDRRLLHTPYSETLAAGVERNATFKYRIETANTGKAAESVGFVPAVKVEVPSDAVLGVFQRENVDHGLRPLPFLRDIGRCRVLGIHIEGARHPSSERNKNRKSSGYSQRPGPIAVGTYDAGSSLHPLLLCIRCFEKRFGPLYYSNKVEPLRNACNQVAPTPLSEQ